MTCRATLLRSKLQSGLLSTAFCKCNVQQMNKSRWQTSRVLTHCLHHIFEQEASKRSCHVVQFSHPLDTPLETNSHQQSRGTVHWKHSAAACASAIS